MSECEVCAGQEYNGWPNRETWAVGLHLDNDYGLYEYRCGLVDVMVASHADWCREHELPTTTRAVFRVADAVESWVRDEFERVFHPMEAVKQGVVVDHQADVWRMMVSDVGSLWRVDWTCLAEHWVDDAMEGDDE